MNIAEIRKIAKKSIKGYSKMKKADLIHKIQVEEGNAPCYAADWSKSCTENCVWSADCRK